MEHTPPLAGQYSSGQYPPPGPPGQYPPPGQPGQYPPPGTPGQYLPPGPPGQYPPPGQPGQYPPPGPSGQYPPPGHYPPLGQTGQYPPVCSVGQFNPTGQYPPSVGYPSSGQLPLPPGWDAEDSDNEDYLRSKHDRNRVNVKFVNKTNSKAKLLWINHKGKFKKMEKIKEGRAENVDTYDTHPFTIYVKKGPELIINGNFTFIAEIGPGSHGEFKAEITHAPANVSSLRSTAGGHPVRVKFSNRTTRIAVLKFVDHTGAQHIMKEVLPKKAFLMDTCEGYYFIAHEKDYEQNIFEFNYGWFYLVKKPLDPKRVPKVLITEPYDDHSSSSD